MAWKKKEHPIVSDRKSVGQKCCTCIQKILPWTWGGFVTRHDWFVPDWEVWIKDIQGVTAAVGLRVRIRKHSSKYEKFPSEHAATVVCQRRHLTLSLTRKSSQIKTIEDVIREVSNVCKNYKMYFLKSHEWITYAPFYYSTSPPHSRGVFGDCLAALPRPGFELQSSDFFYLEPWAVSDILKFLGDNHLHFDCKLKPWGEGAHTPPPWSTSSSGCLGCEHHWTTSCF